jgi:hypothetical protein
MKSIIPVIFAGVVAIYGLIIAVIISGTLTAGGPLTGIPGVTRTDGGSVIASRVCTGLSHTSTAVILWPTVWQRCLEGWQLVWLVWARECASESLVTPVCVPPRSSPACT